MEHSITETEFYPNELIILASRPGIGKTTLALNIAANITTSNKQVVLFASPGMTKIELVLRLICSRAGLDNNWVRRNLLSPKGLAHFKSVADELAKVPIYIDDTPNQTVTDIEAVARRLKQEQELKLIVIDYIGLVTPENPDEPREKQIVTIVRQLKELAMELHVPVLGLALINRQITPERPLLSQLNDSGAIEQYADMVLFIRREDDDVTSKSELIVAKQHDRITGLLPGVALTVSQLSNDLSTLMEMAIPPRESEMFDLLVDAIKSEQIEFVKLLISQGIDVNVRDGDGVTPLHVASRYPFTFGMLKYLVSLGADVNARDNSNRTPLHEVIQHNYDHVKVLQYLISKGADINARDNSGRTLLHYAGEYDYPNADVVRYLVEQHGADINVRDNNGKTPLHYVAGHNPNVEVAKYLIEHGADIRAKGDSGYTPLDVAWQHAPNEEVGIYFLDQMIGSKGRLITDPVKLAEIKRRMEQE